MKRQRKSLLLASASIGAVALSGASIAQDAAEEDFSFEEILVTATKRATSVQDVPLAMTAFDSSMAKRLRLDDAKELIKFSPGMSGDTQDSFLDFVNVRGISTNDFGNGGDASIGMFKNGLYQGRTGSAVTSMFDIDRAEVLRGPQGFLFGRNAISGAISFHTKRPVYDSTEGYIDVGIGERGIFEGEAAFNIPVSENTAMRAAVYTSHDDGYITNVQDPDGDKYYGREKYAGRLSLVTQGESWDAFVMAEFEDKKGSGTVYVPVDYLSEAGVDGAVVDGLSAIDWLQQVTGRTDLARPADARSINADDSMGNRDAGKLYTISAEINVDLDFAKLTSITGYKEHTYGYAEDYDGMPINLYGYDQDQEGDYFEQELRLVSQGDGPLSWYAGASYFRENIDTRFGASANGDLLCAAYGATSSYYAELYYPDYYDTPFTNCADQYAYWGYADPGDVSVHNEYNDTRGDFSGWGAYLDLTYAMTEKLDASIGLRYTKNKKKFALNVPPASSGLGHWYVFAVGTNGFIRDKNTWSDLTPRAIIRYKPTEDSMIYASVTKGFKSGGYNTYGITFDSIRPNGIGRNAKPEFYDPETVWSYEVGMKGNNEGNTVRYDVSAYMYKYKDLQLNYWDAGTKIANLGRVKAYGLEGSLQAALNENFDIILSGSYNNNELNDANDVEPGSDGNRLSGAPKYKASGMFSYHKQVTDTGEMNIGVDFVAQSSAFASGIANVEHNKLPAYETINLNIGYEDDAGWGVNLYATNIFSTVWYDGGYEGGWPTPGVLFGVSPPRTIGLEFSYRWGE